MSFGVWDPLRDIGRLTGDFDRFFGAPTTTTAFDFDRPFSMLTEGEPSYFERSKRAGMPGPTRRSMFPVDTVVSPEVQRDVTWTPRMDIREIGDDIVVHVELPGLTKDDIKLEFNNNVLSISGERKQQELQENETVYRRERVWGKFYRTVRLPESVKDSDISANFDNGVLEIRMPHGKEVKTEKKAIAIS